MNKIAEAECPHCHTRLDVTEAEREEPSKIRRTLRRIARFLQLLSEFGQHTPAARAAPTPATPEWTGPTCGALVTQERGYWPLSGTRGQTYKRELCGKPAPNFERRTARSIFGNVAICDECARDFHKSELIKLKNGQSKTVNVEATK